MPADSVIVSVSVPSINASSTIAYVIVTVDDPALKVTVVPFQVPPETTGEPTSAATEVPPLVALTASVLVVEPLRVNVITIGEPPSLPLVAATVTVGCVAASLSAIEEVDDDGDPTV